MVLTQMRGIHRKYQFKSTGHMFIKTKTDTDRQTNRQTETHINSHRHKYSYTIYDQDRLCSSKSLEQCETRG